MIKILFVGIICSLSLNSLAQGGDIKVEKDSRIGALVESQSKIIPPDVNPKIDGYRIQLYFDSDGSVINNARSRFIARFPKVDTYKEFNAPNYFLKVGDFRTRLEAEKIKAAIEAEFPTSFIIKEKINLPRLDNKDFDD